MPRVVGVTFRRVGKVYYFDPGDKALREGDFVIAETAHGNEFGEVVLEPREVPNEQVVAPLKRIMRVATGDDLEREASNREKEKQAMQVCDEKVAEHSLPMKLLDAECSFDGSLVTFSFSSENRVDFRELVKDIANILRTRVQLHQIGVRDEARIIGGYGACGRPLCCSTFLTTFEPVSMKMAKDQSLFLNPAKFSGCCGKLLCCLRYEHPFYKSAQERLPSVGAILETEHGRVRVMDVNVVSNVLTVENEEGVQLHIPAGKVKLEGLCRRHGVSCGMSEKNCRPLVAGEVDAAEYESPDDEDEEDGNGVALNEPPSAFREQPPPKQTPQRPSGVKFRDPAAKRAQGQNQAPAGPAPPRPATSPGPSSSQANRTDRPAQRPRISGARRRGRRPSVRPQSGQQPEGGE